MRAFAVAICALILSAVSQTAFAQVIYSPIIGGTYLPLAGATVKGKMNVILQGCPATAPWKFSIDTATVINTENGCPYGLIDDEKLWDSTTIADGVHTLKATPASGAAITATFTVANNTLIPPEPPPQPGVGVADLMWTPPTLNTDGSAITLPLTYEVQQSPNWAVVATTDQLTYHITGLADGTWCWRVIAITNARSDPSSQVCKTIGVPPPCTHPASPPVQQTVACTAPTIGNWTQTRTCTEGACPVGGGNTTWTCTAWTPSSAPPGVCATPPPPPLQLACSITGKSANYANGDNRFTLRCPPSALAVGDGITVTRP